MSYFKIWFECIAECLSIVTGKKLEVINMNDYIHVDDYDDAVTEYEILLSARDQDVWKYLNKYVKAQADLSGTTTSNAIISFILVLSIAANIVLAVFLANP